MLPPKLSGTIVERTSPPPARRRGSRERARAGLPRSVCRPASASARRPSPCRPRRTRPSRADPAPRIAVRSVPFKRAEARKRRGDPVVARRLELLDVDRERVSRLRALDVERARLRIVVARGAGPSTASGPASSPRRRSSPPSRRRSAFPAGCGARPRRRRTCTSTPRARAGRREPAAPVQPQPPQLRPPQREGTPAPA